MHRFAKRALEATKSAPALRTAIVHPVKTRYIEAALEAEDEALMEAVLVGPEHKMKAAIEEAGVKPDRFEMVFVEHSHEAAETAAAMAAEGKVDALMKGGLHTGELLEGILSEKRLRTERRLSHVYAFDTPDYHKPFFITDAAINIAPTLSHKADIVQNAVHLWRALQEDETALAKVAVLAAVETVNPDMPATIDAAALCKMVDRGQITGCLMDGPLAFDNAVSKEAAARKGITSEVAGDPDILLAPDLEAGNMMAKQLTFMGDASAAAIVLGARVPVILTSRADSQETRLLSVALAVRIAEARKAGRFV